MEATRIESGMLVRIRYSQELIHRDGTFAKDEPREVVFLFGVERQIPSLENNLKGCQTGDSLTISIEEEELFGPFDPELVREIPKKDLKMGRLQRGRVYREIKRGALITFVAREIRDDSVLADFNHPNAGAKARARVTILDVRKPQQEDMLEALDRVGCPK